jgi:hypothetical protein
VAPYDFLEGGKIAPADRSHQLLVLVGDGQPPNQLSGRTLLHDYRQLHLEDPGSSRERQGDTIPIVTALVGQAARPSSCSRPRSPAALAAPRRGSAVSWQFRFSLSSFYPRKSWAAATGRDRLTNPTRSAGVSARRHLQSVTRRLAHGTLRAGGSSCTTRLESRRCSASR